MGNNIIDLSNIESRDLMLELRRRGWKTELMFGLDDVDLQLESINDERDEEDKIVLEDIDKQNILDDVFDNVDYYIERVNTDIEDKILDYE
jgi:hypothetical protein